MNNKRAGNRAELYAVKLLKPIYPDAMTSRYGSREQDDKGIDILNTGSIAVQVKRTKKRPNFAEVFDHMNTSLAKVLFWKDANIRGKKGEYAILPMEDLLKLLMDLEG